MEVEEQTWGRGETREERKSKEEKSKEEKRREDKEKRGRFEADHVEENWEGKDIHFRPHHNMRIRVYHP